MIFKLYSDIKIVPGYYRSLMIDLRSSDLKVITNDIGEFLGQKTIYKEKCLEEEQQFLDYLVSNEMGFYCDSEEEASLFPEISKEFDYPAQISNSIIEIGRKNIKHLDKIFKELNALGCEYVAIWIVDLLQEEEINNLVSKAIEYNFLSLDIALNYHSGLSPDFWCEYIEVKECVVQFKIYNYTENEYENNIQNTEFKQEQLNSDSCGCVLPEKFVVNLPFFNESLNHNTCLHKKIAVDVEGNIKNCPNMNKQYGNIKTHSLLEVISDDDFVSNWNIKKDEIEVCKDCEFRNVCMDCRAFVDDSKNNLSRPSKCDYNPYICKREGEEGYKSLEECGVISTDNGFSIDHKKIAEINKELWGE